MAAHGDFPIKVFVDEPAIRAAFVVEWIIVTAEDIIGDEIVLPA